jgi:hypothetical protein
MTSQQVPKKWEEGRVLPFRPRASRFRNDKPRRRDQPRSPVCDLSAYSRGPEEDDYRHLMLMNLLAFLVLSLIVFCGIWLADSLSQRPKDQCPSAYCLPVPVISNPR